jgi:ADP-ribose pyrophosphatase YjhB (NUDIX family)
MAQAQGYLSDEDYAFIYNRSPRICVDLVVRNKEGAILLTKRNIEPYKDHWHFPGGRIKFRETAEQAIKRILKGELGQDTNWDAKPLGFCEFLEEIQDGNERHSISLVHEIQLTDDIQVRIDSNSKDSDFFFEIPEPTIPPQKEFLIKHDLL